MKSLSFKLKLFLFSIIISIIIFFNFYCLKFASFHSLQISSQFQSLQEWESQNNQILDEKKLIDIHKWGKNVSFKVVGGNIFKFLTEIIVDSLQDLGFNATRIDEIDLDDQDDDSIYILTWLFSLPFPRKNKFIMYNFEQLRPTQMFLKRPQTLLELSKAIEIWDYSLDNIKYTASFGIQSKLMLPGYSLQSFNQTLASTQILGDRSNMAGFCGTLNDRRREMLSSFTDSNITIVETKEFDDLIGCKVVLNIHTHHKDEAILEIFRLIKLIPLKLFILSERSGDEFLDSLFGNFITFFDSSQDAVNQINAVYEMSLEEYKEIVSTRLENFKNVIPTFKSQLLHTDSWIWEPGSVQLPSH